MCYTLEYVLTCTKLPRMKPADNIHPGKGHKKRPLGTMTHEI